MTPFLSPDFPLMYLKRCTHDFNLQLLTIQLLTYKTSSLVNFHIGGHVCMSISVCHLIFYVISRPPCYHAVCWLPDVFMCMFARYKTSVCTLFWLTKSCLCVTFSIWHHLFHLTTHISSRNDVPLLEFNLRTLLCIQLLTHETMYEIIGFTDSKDSVYCKKTCMCATFWLTWSCACANFDTRTLVCAQFRT